MRIIEHRFSLPFAVFMEPMPDKAFRLLCFLFSISDFRGGCRPGYQAMKQGAEIGSDATVKASLEYLRTKGWIWDIKKGGSKRMTIVLEIPSRLRQKDIPMAVFRGRVSIKEGKTVLQSVKKKSEKVIVFPLSDSAKDAVI